MQLVKKDRLLTGIALIAVAAFLAFLDSPFMMWVVFGALLLISIYELQSLISYKDDTTYITASIVWIASYFLSDQIILPILAMVFIVSYGAYHKSFELKKIVPLLYPTIPFIALFAMYKEFGISSLILVVVIVAISDTGAFFVGKLVGKRAFCVTSPNKTLEGFAGGLVLATIVGSVIASFNYDMLFSILFSILVSISSTFGDLFESYLKREADVKDSGNILPGHGGILDRMDGYMFSSVVAYFLLQQTI
jgi:phosphatidate cytidylyltransferase